MMHCRKKACESPVTFFKTEYGITCELFYWCYFLGFKNNEIGNFYQLLRKTVFPFIYSLYFNGTCRCALYRATSFGFEMLAKEKKVIIKFAKQTKNKEDRNSHLTGLFPLADLAEGRTFTINFLKAFVNGRLKSWRLPKVGN